MPNSQSYYSPVSSSSGSFFSNSTLTVMDNKKLGELENLTSSATGAGSVVHNAEMANLVAVSSLPATGIVCGRNTNNNNNNNIIINNNSHSLDSSTSDLIYLDSAVNSSASESGLYASLNGTVKLLPSSISSSTPSSSSCSSSGAPMHSPMGGMLCSPHRLTPLVAAHSSSMHSPLLAPSGNSSTSGSANVLPPVSTFMFPSSQFRSDCSDWWADRGEHVTSSNLVTAKLVSSTTTALCDPDADFYNLINGTDYSLSHASTTAAL